MMQFLPSHRPLISRHCPPFAGISIPGLLHEPSFENPDLIVPVSHDALVSHSPHEHAPGSASGSAVTSMAAKPAGHSSVAAP